MMINERNIQLIIRYTKSALIDAGTAVRQLDGHANTEKSETARLRAEVGASLTILGGLNELSIAETLYRMSSTEDDEFQLFEDIVHKYKVFADEIISDTATDHSHQWSYIEYDRLVDAVEGTEFWVDTLRIGGE